ncbi:MAG: hypothetical protein JSS02_03585, partial [Planctomycetes bacterium]|nr:hypothetical protein [Planctomycetota bacterium]
MTYQVSQASVRPNEAGWAVQPRAIDVPSVLAREAWQPPEFFRGTSRPSTRWWWLAGPFQREDITRQLTWLKTHGFGGVELAWIWPKWVEGHAPGVDWLSEEWSDLIAFTKQEADRLGLACDFTLGSCWPFGGSVVTREMASQTLQGLSRQRLHGSWESARDLMVLNHLNRESLRRYAAAMIPALSEAL